MRQTKKIEEQEQIEKQWLLKAEENRRKNKVDYSGARVMFDFNCKASKLGSQKPRNNYNIPKLQCQVNEYAYIDNQQVNGEVAEISNSVNITLKEKKSEEKKLRRFTKVKE